LNELLSTIELTSMHFIRCVKPNTAKRARELQVRENSVLMSSRNVSCVILLGSFRAPAAAIFRADGSCCNQKVRLPFPTKSCGFLQAVLVRELFVICSYHGCYIFLQAHFIPSTETTCA
jgi:hypothetical protein